MDELQAWAKDFVDRQPWAGEPSAMRSVMATTEEGIELVIAYHLGQLNRAALKRDHGVRGTEEEWTAEIRKEAADTLLCLYDLANEEGFSLEQAARERFAELENRDPNHDPIGTA